MTDAERLVLVLTADAVIGAALNPCARMQIAELTRARHALDGEAHATPDPVQALDKALADIQGIVRSARNGSHNAYDALWQIDAIARNARRWLELGT